MRKKISQVDARMYKKRCESLERTLQEQKNRWKRDWSYGWINIESLDLDPASFAKLSTARLLNHAIVVQCDQNGRTVRFYADGL